MKPRVVAANPAGALADAIARGIRFSFDNVQVTEFNQVRHRDALRVGLDLAGAKTRTAPLEIVNTVQRRPTR